MEQTIKNVLPGSIGEELGFEAGDSIISINGEKIQDRIDFEYLCAAEELLIELQKKNGKKLDLEFQKDLYEPLGLEFENWLMDEPRRCKNNCVFCFIDQLPEGTRESLQFKDDDWRLSFAMGNYVSLTNISDQELDRIIKRHVSPLYISVHATEPSVRRIMTRNPNAGRIMDQLKRLAAAGLSFHTQIVLCPQINDGKILDQTISDISSLWPALQSIAAVPVGLTCHREGLYELRKLTKDEAKRAINQIRNWQQCLHKKMGEPFVYASDELYIAAGEELPPYEDYSGFAQIENGVGLIRLFEREFEVALEDAKPVPARHLSLATGESAATFMRDICSRLKLFGAEISVYPIKNFFFGETVTVAGLVTGADIASQLKGKDLGERLIIPHCMLREQEDIFLDDMTLEQLQKTLNVPVQAISVDGERFIQAVLGVE